MKLDEVFKIIKRLFREYVKKHYKRILLAFVLSLIVAASTSGIAWLLDPAVKKIFIEQNKVFAWSIPLLIVIAFSSKGLSLYFARINIIRVAEEVTGELQKKVATNILISDIQTLDNRHSGKYISNIMYDTHHVQTLVGTGVLNLMKDTFSVIGLVSLMFYQNWKLALFAILMSMVGCYYYLRFAQAMFFDDLALDNDITLVSNQFSTAVVGVLGFAIVILGVYPNIIMQYAISMLSNL